jgi:predicted AAA+ superfamily ATPase
MESIEGTVPREGYLKRLRAGKDHTNTIKVITGVRRSGKSTLLRQFMYELKASGIEEDRIFYMNFESEEYQHLEEYKEVQNILRNSIDKKKRTYVFLDEVQRITGWEKNANSLMVDYDADIYVTGSNAYLLSSELATYLSGRYVEIKMLPLSFKEYLVLHPLSNEKNIDQRFQEYLRYGALPIIRPDIDSDTYIKGQLEGVYNTVLMRDVVERLKLRNVEGIKRISRFLFSNIGNLTNINTIATKAELSPTTVKDYVEALEDAYLLYKVNRFDVIGKKILMSNEKYYVSDTGIRNMDVGWSSGAEIWKLLENIVYLELVRRGYGVVVGSYKDKEIDFTATGINGIEYYQVAQSILDPKAAEREARALDGVNDNYPKTIITMDRIRNAPGKGIRHLNVIDWLLDIQR